VKVKDEKHLMTSRAVPEHGVQVHQFLDDVGAFRSDLFTHSDLSRVRSATLAIVGWRRRWGSVRIGISCGGICCHCEGALVQLLQLQSERNGLLHNLKKMERISQTEW
jgi:hypothetical protein